MRTDEAGDRQRRREGWGMWAREGRDGEGDGDVVGLGLVLSWDAGDGGGVLACRWVDWPGSSVALGSSQKMKPLSVFRLNHCLQLWLQQISSKLIYCLRFKMLIYKCFAFGLVMLVSESCENVSYVCWRVGERGRTPCLSVSPRCEYLSEVVRSDHHGRGAQ